ncbi:hypothetical protein E4L95_18130 [Paracoccus liaowanqingii]|uniref:HTH luxR-type domain-containing protein n=1 Tax=Paracoccus liaowanqingii TaxID=2560053 RepID=A0A4Z1C5X8_9RHOB|nr:hypothetical protein E4L95_18130 [Paracoccus liaowanqingii]
MAFSSLSRFVIQMFPYAIERLLVVETVPEIREVFLEGAAQLGFDFALYAAQFMLSVPSSVLRDKPIVFTNFPLQLMAEAQMLGRLDSDPWIQWVLDNDGEIAADDLQALPGVVSPSLQLAARHGLGQCQIVSLRDKVLDSVGAVLVVPEQGADAATLARRWRQSGRELRVLAWVMHMRIATMNRALPVTTLTPRQREVLTWRSAGKTVGEVATILGITPATVEKHTRLAREALGVATTSQAVLKAHVCRLLVPPDPSGPRGPGLS